jgi:hypothetical protein
MFVLELSQACSLRRNLLVHSICLQDFFARFSFCRLGKGVLEEGNVTKFFVFFGVEM